ITRTSPGKRAESARRRAWKFFAPLTRGIFRAFCGFQSWSMKLRKASGGAVSWLARAGDLGGVFVLAIFFMVMLFLCLSQAAVQTVRTRAHEREGDERDAHLDRVARLEEGRTLGEILRGR